MAKYGVIIALLANLVASRALEDPDLIRNCGDAKALALGLPATTRGSQLYHRLYKISLTPSYHPDPVQENGAKSRSLNIAEAAPSINLAAQHYAVTEGPSSYTNARQSLNAIKVGYDSSAKVSAPVIPLLRSPLESFSSLPHSPLTFTPITSFSNDGAENVVLKYNPPNQYENAPVLKYSFKPINYQAVNFNDASTTSHTNSRLVESFASTSNNNASSASSYVSVSSPITSKVSNADTSVNVKENIYGLNFASQNVPRPFSQLARVFLVAPVTKQVQNNVAASPVVNSPTAPAVSTSYIRVMSGIGERKYPTSDENYNGRVTLASATQSVNKAGETQKGSDQDKYYDAHPRYMFEYKVHDVHTGDQKEQREQREGDVVNGHYSLLQPDGNVRTVTYNADWETGFHAQVKYSKKL